MNTHLTEEQIDDVLISGASANTEFHLASCVECRQRLEEIRQPLAVFSSVTLAWNERRSATMPPPSVSAQNLVWNWKLNWVLAAFVLVAAGFVLPLATRDTPGGRNMTAVGAAPSATPQQAKPSLLVSSSQGHAPAAAVHAVSDSEVQRDNQVLEAIHDELDASVQSPADAFGLSQDTRAGGGRGRNAPVPSWD